MYRDKSMYAGKPKAIAKANLTASAAGSEHWHTLEWWSKLVLLGYPSEELVDQGSLLLLTEFGCCSPFS